MRLDKFIGHVTDLSRNDAKRAIRDGAVTIAGEVARDPAMAVATDAAVSLYGRPLRAARSRYFMLHKPAGVVSATRDRLHPTAIDLLEEDNPEALHIVGRLDLDTTGLLLITDDGRWAHQVASPRRHCDKRYRVETAEPIAADTAVAFARGLWLANERRRLQPAQLRQLGPQVALLTIAEGKYHQVKRMFAAVGNAVTQLHREAVGSVELDAELAPGEYRPLTAAEVAGLAGSEPESAGSGIDKGGE